MKTFNTTTFLAFFIALTAMTFSSNSSAQTVGGLKVGDTYTFISKNFPANCFHCEKDQHCDLKAVAAISDKALGSFKIVAGLDGGSTVSFESIKHPGHYLRHQNFQLKLHTGTDDFLKKDASFKVVKGLADDQQVSFEAANFAGHYIKHSGFKLFVHKTDNSDLFKTDATFVASTPLNSAGSNTNNQVSDKLSVNTVYSFESMNSPQSYFQAYLGSRISRVYTEALKAGASFHIVESLAGPGMVSFRSVMLPDYYLVNEGSKLTLQKLKLNDPLYNKKSSFKVQDGLADDQMISFESLSQPDAYIRHKEKKLYVEKQNGNPDLFKKDATFKAKKGGFTDSFSMKPNKSLQNMGLTLEDAYAGKALCSLQFTDKPQDYIGITSDRGECTKIENPTTKEDKLKASFRVIPYRDDKVFFESLSSDFAGYLFVCETSSGMTRYLMNKGLPIYEVRVWDSGSSFTVHKNFENKDMIFIEDTGSRTYFIRHENISSSVLEQTGQEKLFKKNASLKVVPPLAE